MEYYLSPKLELSKFLVDKITSEDSIVLSMLSSHINGTSFRYIGCPNLLVQIISTEQIESDRSYNFCIYYNLFNRLENSTKPLLLRENAMMLISNDEYKEWLRGYKINIINE